MKCSYSGVLYHCMQFVHVFCSGTPNKIFAVHNQDGICTCKPHAVLAVHCNYYIHVHVYTDTVVWPHVVRSPCFAVQVHVYTYIHVAARMRLQCRDVQYNNPLVFSVGVSCYFTNECACECVPYMFVYVHVYCVGTCVDVYIV